MESKRFKWGEKPLLHYPEVFYVILKARGDTVKRGIQITVYNEKGCQRGLEAFCCARLSFFVVRTKAETWEVGLSPGQCVFLRDLGSIYK